MCKKLDYSYNDISSYHNLEFVCLIPVSWRVLTVQTIWVFLAIVSSALINILK